LSYITEVEPNDYYSTGMLLEIGTVAGNTLNASDCDWYIANLEANKEYTVELKGIQTGNDLDLYLYNSQLGQPVVQSTHFGDTDESVTITPSATGNYYIYVHNYEFLSTGNHTYQLMLYSNDSTPDSYEPNDNIPTSKTIEFDMPVNGNININTDEDWYAVNVDEPGRITVTLDDITYGCDYDIAVYDENASYISGSYFSGNESEKANIIVNNTGTYYIRVYSYSGSDYLSNYELNVVSSTPDIYENNDFIDQSTSMFLGNSFNATIDNENDDDWFNVNINETGNFTFELQNIPSGTDYDIYIYDYLENVVSYSVSGSNTNEFININLDPGRYYMQVHPFSGHSDTKQYLLSAYKENTLCIEMPNDNKNSGDVLQIPVNINNIPTEGICNFDFVIRYDKNILTYTGFDAGSLTIASGEGFTVQEISGGLKVLFYVNNSNLSDTIRTSGNLFKLNFQINSNVSDGAYNISYGDIWCFSKPISDGSIGNIEKVIFKPGVVYVGSYNINSFQSVSYLGTEE
ncbi:MAG: hypothetical protein GX660_11425, partial [Clostridiaceae bacterium]|nr:hypothetical protein [Clostridiaceae bacterium]